MMRPLFRPIHYLASLMLVTAIHMPASAAASEDSHEGFTRLLIIGLTVIGALLVGLFLYYLSQQSSQVRFEGRGPEVAGAAPAPKAGAAAKKASSADPKELTPVILEELNQLSGATPAQRDRVARSLSTIVNKQLEERVGTVKKELDQRHQKVIEEHQRNEVVLQKKYQSTLSEKQQTSAVLESIAEGLVVVNNKGEVVMMNPAAEKLLAVNQQERAGKPLMDNVQEGQLISLVGSKSEEEKDRDIILNAKQESTKKVLRASNAMITDENGQTVGMVSVLSDVTKQRELDQLKSDFVSKVSHELRTPIVAMQHALSILFDQVAGPLTEEQQKFVSLSQRNLDRLNRLINDLLDLSKLEASKMELQLETQPLAPVLETACDSLEMWAKSKAVTISRRIEDGLPDVPCDQARVTQVLTNLVGNAIKFTPKQGRITVEAKRSADGTAVEVSVSDTGTGIAKEDLPKLFSKFQQVGERSASDIGGTGLGLAISKEIVELHQGKIWVESELQQGAKFIFTLPLVQAASEGADVGAARA